MLANVLTKSKILLIYLEQLLIASSVSANKIAEDLLKQACDNAKNWNNSWIIFMTPKITAVILKWDKTVLKYVGVRCKVLYVLYWLSFIQVFTVNIFI